MADKVKFELVSPEKMLISEDVDMVVVPGTEGYFGVLPGHAPLISTVRPGTIDIYQGSTVRERLFVAGGFAEVTAERCTVLADEAMPVSELSRDRAEAELADVNRELPALQAAAQRGEAEETVKLKAAERRQAVAQAQIDALSGPTAH